MKLGVRILRIWHFGVWGLQGYEEWITQGYEVLGCPEYSGPQPVEFRWA